MRSKKKKRTGSPELTALELTVMKVLWKNEDASAGEVTDELRKERSIALTTVHTVLGNLEKKGAVKRIPRVERSLRFRPTIKQREIAEKTVKKVVFEFFDNSPQLLMTHLIRKEAIDEKELAELQKMIRERRRKKERGND